MRIQPALLCMLIKAGEMSVIDPIDFEQSALLLHDNESIDGVAEGPKAKRDFGRDCSMQVGG